MHTKSIYKIFTRLAFAFGLLQFLRLIFLLWNWPLYKNFPAVDLIESFYRSLRFDLSTVVYVYGLWILVSLIPWQNKYWQRLNLFLFWLAGTSIAFINLIDTEFYQFSRKRITIDVLLLSEDIGRQTFSMITYYWKLGLLFVVVSTAIYYFWRWSDQKFQETKPLNWRVVIYILLFLPLAVIGARGGLQHRPIGPINAYTAKGSELGILTLNSALTFIRSRISANDVHVRYFDKDEEAEAIVREMAKSKREPLGWFKNKNVVVIVVESLALEFVGVANNGKGYTPFLDELSKKGLFFNNFFANGRRSIDGLPSVFCALPSMIDEAILTSPFAGNEILCLPQVLHPQGYSSVFVHAAHNGSMQIDAFSARAGFQKFVGFNEIKTKPYYELSQYDGNWGLLDEPMFDVLVDEINQLKPPFLAGAFTLTSHHPYFIPLHLRGKFSKGTLPIHESIGYVDYSIRHFFEVASKQKWYNDTIFFITSDHCTITDQPGYKDDVGQYRVPLLVYAPGHEWAKVRQTRIAQHSDLMPSILDLLGIKADRGTNLGISFFDETLPERAFNKRHPGHWYIDSERKVTWNYETKEGEMYKHDHTQDFTPVSDLRGEEALKALKALLHRFNTGALQNKWIEKNN